MRCGREDCLQASNDLIGSVSNHQQVVNIPKRRYDSSKCFAQFVDRILCFGLQQLGCPHPAQNSTLTYRSSTKFQAQRRPPIVEHSLGGDSDCCCCCCRRREARSPSRPPRRLRYLPVYRRLQASSPGSEAIRGVWIRKRRSGRHRAQFHTT